MLKSRHRAALVAMVCACVFSACDDTPEKTEGAAPAAPAKAPAQKLASIGNDMVAAVSAGKSSSVISVHFALRATPTVNTALPVDVAIVPHRDFSSLIVHFNSQDGLATTTGNVFGPKTNLGTEDLLTHQLVLLPTREGMFMVSSTVDTESSEGKFTRVYSIPVIVTAAPSPSEPATN